MQTISRPTIRDIAKEAEVSVATVSRYLTPGKRHLVRPKTAAVIAQVIQKHRYVPNISARNLSKLQTNTILLVIPFYPGAFGNEYFSQLISGIFRAIEGTDYNFKFLTLKSRPSGEEFHMLIRSNAPAGILLSHYNLLCHSVDDILNLEVPTILLNETIDHPSISYVSASNFKGAYEAIRYLISMGHEKIGIIRGNPNSGDDIARFQGCQKALEESNLPRRKEWVLVGDFIEDGGYKCGMQLLLMKEKPTAIFCANDDMARGVYRALDEMSLCCPDDLSCMGFDNSLISSYLSPSLTTVSQPVEEMGYQATQWLLQMLSHALHSPLKQTLDTNLVIRKSVRKLDKTP